MGGTWLTAGQIRAIFIVGPAIENTVMTAARNATTAAPRTVDPIMRLLRFIPSLSIDNVELGQAMLQTTLDGRRSGTLENREIRANADRYRSKLPPVTG